MPYKNAASKATVAALVITGAVIGASVVPLVHVLFKTSAQTVPAEKMAPAPVPASSSSAPKL